MSRTAWRLVSAAPVMALVVAAGVTGSGCRSAAKPAPRVAGPTRPDPLAGWVGQTRILRHRGDAGKWTVKKADLKAAGGTCDVAVEVKQARLASGIASFSFEMIGRPRTAKRGARQEKCGDDQAMIAVTVTGFDPAATAADVESALAETLQTPEAYMRSYQVAYEVPPPPKTEEAKGESTSAAARSYKVQALKKDVPLADHHLTQKAKRVFWVDAITRDPAHKISYEAEVEFKAVVGWDGLIYQPTLSTALSEDHEKRVLRVLPLWRFEPARKGADPAAANVIEHLVFRIY
jgi:hypothetical protein